MSLPTIAPSGLYYPNNVVNIYVNAIEEVLGKEAINSILRNAGLERLIDNYPPNNFERKFDFADFSLLNAGVDAYTGNDDEKAMAIGAACYAGGNRGFGGLAGMGGVSMVFKTLPLNVRLKLGLTGMATIFSTFTDQHTELHEHDDHFEYVILKCPVCWGRTSNRPTCAMAMGLLQEGLRSVSDNYAFHIEEIACQAMGDAACIFTIPKPTDA
jgi:hypothetical protein